MYLLTSISTNESIAAGFACNKTTNSSMIISNQTKLTTIKPKVDCAIECPCGIPTIVSFLIMKNITQSLATSY